MTIAVRIIFSSLILVAWGAEITRGIDWTTTRAARASARKRSPQTASAFPFSMNGEGEDVAASEKDSPVQLQPSATGLRARDETTVTPPQPLAESRHAYEAMVQQDPLDPLPFHRLAVMAARDGNYAEAHQYFRSALDLSADNPTLLSDIGYCYYLEERLDAAERVLSQAVKQKPDDATICNNLGLVLAAQKKYDESLAQFLRVGSESQASANLAIAQKRHSQFGQPAPAVDPSTIDNDSANLYVPVPQRLPDVGGDEPQALNQVIDAVAELDLDPPLTEPTLVQAVVQQTAANHPNPLRRTAGRINAKGENRVRHTERDEISAATKQQTDKPERSDRPEPKRPVSRFLGPVDLLFGTHDETNWPHGYPNTASPSPSKPNAIPAAGISLPYQRGVRRASTSSETSKVQQDVGGTRFELSDQAD